MAIKIDYPGIPSLEELIKKIENKSAPTGDTLPDESSPSSLKASLQIKKEKEFSEPTPFKIDPYKKEPFFSKIFSSDKYKEKLIHPEKILDPGFDPYAPGFNQDHPYSLNPYKFIEYLKQDVKDVIPHIKNKLSGFKPTPSASKPNPQPTPQPIPAPSTQTNPLFVQAIGKAEGNEQFLGGKGYHLNEMAKIGLPVPPGFIITTRAYRHWRDEYGFSKNLQQAIENAILALEQETEEELFSAARPLLVSIRSGAPVSMPGMMDTVLNFGLDSAVAAVLEEKFSDKQEPYRMLEDQIRTIMNWPKTEPIPHKIPNPPIFQMYVTLKGRHNIDAWLASSGLPPKPSPDKLREALHEWVCLCNQLEFPVGGSFNKLKNFGLEGIVFNYQNQKVRLIGIEDQALTVQKITGKKKKTITIGINSNNQHTIDIRPQIYASALDCLTRKAQVASNPDNYRERVSDTYAYLKQDGMIPAQNDRVAAVLHQVKRIFESWYSDRAIEYRRLHGIPDQFGTAVVVQRMVHGNQNTDSGSAVIFTSDITTGEEKTTGVYLSQSQGEDIVSGKKTPKKISLLKEENETMHDTIESISRTIEEISGHPQDVEITWEAGRLYVLQKRNAKLTDRANVKVQLKRYHEGKITSSEVIKAISPKAYAALLHQPVIQGADTATVLARGEAILGEIISGKVVTSMQELDQNTAKQAIYVTPELQTEDLATIAKTVGIISNKGSCYSHAGIVSTNMKKLLVAGCENITINGEIIHFGEQLIKIGDAVTMDGNTGTVYKGRLPVAFDQKAEGVDELTAMAIGLIAKLPRIYVFQCQQDLEKYAHLRSNPLIMYDLSFDVTQAAKESDVQEFLKNTEPLSKKEQKNLEDALQPLAKATAEIVLAFQSGQGYITLGNKFDSLILADNPSRIHHVKEAFMQRYAGALGKNAKRQVFLEEPNCQLNFSGIRKRNTNLLVNGKNHVRVMPWEQELSCYVAAYAAVNQTW